MGVLTFGNQFVNELCQIQLPTEHLQGLGSQVRIITDSNGLAAIGYLRILVHLVVYDSHTSILGLGDI